MTILVLDDDSDFRNGLAENLRDDGHEVHTFVSPAEIPVLDALGHIQVVVTDHHMPEQNGLAFADAFHALHPQVPVVLVTADPSWEFERAAGRRPFITVCRKPIDYSDLSELICESENPGQSHP